MSAKSAIALTAACLVLVACIPSVHPWYTPDDVVFEPRLIGEWGSGPDDDERWIFERLSGEDAYMLTITETGKRSRFKATFFTLRDYQFIDLFPEGDISLADDEVGIMEAAYAPGHLVMHVADIEPRLRMNFFDPDWVMDYLDENPNALEHRRDGDRILLTGRTRELQRFLLRHIEDDEFFDSSDYSDFTRQ